MPVQQLQGGRCRSLSEYDVTIRDDLLWETGFDILTRPPIQEESDSPEEEAPEEEALNTPEPQQEEEGDDEIPTIDPEVIENESSVCIPFPFLFPLLTYS